MDFFTPVVDDPYAFGAIAAANALSDVYAMGGWPATVMNIACFDPTAAPPEVWAEIFRGMADKTIEAGAVIVGGHSVEDSEPKFGMSVTGFVEADRIFRNDQAANGDEIFLTKPLGTGIATTAAKFDKCSDEELEAAILAMSTLNRDAAEAGQEAGVRCATDITGFGLAGHLWNIAEASGVRIEIQAGSLPILPGIQRMAEDGCLTGGAGKNAAFVGDRLSFEEGVPEWLRQAVLDPQTSGGLALFGQGVGMGRRIGRVVPGEPGIAILAGE